MIVRALVHYAQLKGIFDLPPSSPHPPSFSAGAGTVMSASVPCEPTGSD